MICLILSTPVRAGDIFDFLDSDQQCHDPDPPVNQDGTSNEEEPGECYDWEYLLGQQCPNNYPPGEIPGGETEPPGGGTDTGGTDTGGGADTGGGGFVIEDIDCLNCEIIDGPGGVNVWVNDDDTGNGGPDDTGGGPGDTGGGAGDTGGGAGDTGESNMSESSGFAGLLFDRIPVGHGFFIGIEDAKGFALAQYKLKGKKYGVTSAGEREVKVYLERQKANRVIPLRSVVTINQCETTFQPY